MPKSGPEHMVLASLLSAGNKNETCWLAPRSRKLLQCWHAFVSVEGLSAWRHSEVWLRIKRANTAKWIEVAGIFAALRTKSATPVR